MKIKSDFLQLDEKNFKEIGIYVVIILALLRFVDTPLRQRRDEALLRLSVMSKEKSSLSRIANKMKIMEKEIDKRRVILQDNEERFYASNTEDIEIYAAMLGKLTKFAEKENLKIINFSTSQPRGHEIKTFTVTLRMSGSMKSLTNFIKDVKRLKKIFLIKRLNLAPKKSGVMIRIDVEGYKLKK